MNNKENEDEDEPDTSDASDTDSVRSSSATSDAFGSKSGRSFTLQSWGPADSCLTVDEDEEGCQEDCGVDFGVAKIHRHIGDPQTEPYDEELRPAREPQMKRFRVDELLKGSNLELEFSEERLNA